METTIPAESPVLFGLHPNAEIGGVHMLESFTFILSHSFLGYLETMSWTIFETILNVGGGGGKGGGTSGVAAVMEAIMEKLPPSFILVIPSTHEPFVSLWWVIRMSCDYSGDRA